MLSIVVPVYNAEKTIKRCIESILQQTFKDYELILVDDGSTDSSQILCQSYADKDTRIKLYTKENGGVSSARNLGMDKARGEFITFVDADDYLEPGCYEHIASKSYDCDLLFFHYTFETKAGREKIYNKNLDLLKKNPRNFMLLYVKSSGTYQKDMLFDESISIFVWRLWCRLDYIRSYRLLFDETLRAGEDRIFLLNCLLHEPKIAICDDEFGYIHTVSEYGNSLTDLKNLKTYVPWMYSQQKNMDYAEQTVFQKNTKMDSAACCEVRLERAEKMRNLVIINEFRNNSKNARKRIKEYTTDEFFKWAYNHYNILYVIKKRNWRELVRFLLVKFRQYRILERMYSYNTSA